MSNEETRNREKRIMLYSISVITSAIPAFFSSYFIFSNSAGYLEASKWVPIAPLFLSAISIGAAIVAALVSIAITNKTYERMNAALIIIISVVVGVIIGAFAGFFCNLWR